MSQGESAMEDVELGTSSEARAGAAPMSTTGQNPKSEDGQERNPEPSSKPPLGYTEDDMLEGEGEEDFGKGSKSTSEIFDTLVMVFQIAMLTLALLLPAILVYVGRPGNFRLYNIFGVKINSPNTNPSMEFIRWSAFLYVILAGYLLVEWLVGVFPYLVLRLLKWCNYSVTPRTRRFVSYFVAAQKWFTITFWILFVATFGATLLYRTNILNTLSQGLLSKAGSAAAAAAAQAKTPVRNGWYYLERSLLVFAIFCIFRALTKYLLELIKVSFHRMAFEERVSGLNFRFQVITKLYAAIKDPGKRIALGKKSRDIHLVWDRHGDLSSEKRAIDLANDLYQKLVPNNRDYLTMDDFSNFFIPADLERAFKAFDKNGNGDVDRSELRDVILDLYEQRRLVSLGLGNNNIIIEKLGLILSAVTVFFTFTFSIPIFELGGAAVFAIFGLLWTGLGFLFQNTAKQCFEAIVFVFVEHAYDVGDRVVVDNEYLTVERVEIFTTVFRRWDGMAVYIPNSNLASKNIYNVRRSSTQTDFLDLPLALDTPIATIWELRDRLADFARSEPKDYTGRVDLVSFDTELDKCKVQLAVEYRTNFQDAALRASRRNKFMAMLKENVDGLAISVTELDTIDFQEGCDYALWFYLGHDQTCFVELKDGRLTRQPEFLLKGENKDVVVELFRGHPQGVFVGEARVSTAYLCAANEQQLVLEITQRPGLVVATVLLGVETFDDRKKNGSGKSSLKRTVSNVDLSPSLAVMELQALPSSSFVMIDNGSSGRDSAKSIRIESSTCSPHTDDFLVKFTLSGSPSPGLRSESSLPEAVAIISTDSLVTGDSLHVEEDIIERNRRMSLGNVSEASRRSPLDVKGLVSLEIVAAQNLPREKRMLRVHYQNNPFAVISFGKQSFRTKVVKRTVNPVWREKLYFTVKESEASYHLMFSIYDYDKFSYNSCIGTASLEASVLLDHPNVIQKLALKLNLTTPTGLDDAYVLVKACFISYDVLRKNFWEILARQYDHDDNGKLNRIELTSMLESIGSTLSEDTLDSILQRLDVDGEGEIEIGNIVASLEALTVKARLPEHEEENIVLIKSCPVCTRHFRCPRDDIDVITHLAVCVAKDTGKLDRFMMGGFLTEDYASRKWFMKILSFMSFGGYRIGKNNGNILVQDRKTGKLFEERMPTYIRLGIRWMHQYSAYSRAVDSSMVRQIFQSLTLKQGRKFDDPASAKNIPEFIRYHKLNVEEILDPLDSFKTFNEFFYRRLKPGSRRLASANPIVCVSPADCRLNCFPTVAEATQLWIKGTSFSMANLLRDEMLAQYYDGGSLVVCRLAPQDYHRFHSPVDGKLSMFYHIPGTYFTVNPMAVRQKIDVYTENARTVCLIDSAHFGQVAYVAIGAMMVGSIVITAEGGKRISRLDELGYFAFGGSTIVVIFPPKTVVFDEDLVANSRDQLETLVLVGNSLGHSIRSLGV